VGGGVWVRSIHGHPAPAEDLMTDTCDGTTSPKLRVWLRPDGIVQVVWLPGVQVGLEDVAASADAVDTLMGGHRHPILVDLRAGGQAMGRAARMAVGRREEAVEELVSAIALVVNTPLGRLTGNMFIALRKPTPPMRLFGDEASAVTWLCEFAP
jgi:hypothetical protein